MRILLYKYCKFDDINICILVLDCEYLYPQLENKGCDPRETIELEIDILCLSREIALVNSNI